jgi:hypothetical protein
MRCELPSSNISMREMLLSSSTNDLCCICKNSFFLSLNQIRKFQIFQKRGAKWAHLIEMSKKGWWVTVGPLEVYLYGDWFC